MLPMGTIVTVCMLTGLLFAAPYAVKDKLKPLPSYPAWIVGCLVFVAGVWNTFWHGFRHLTEFWGLAALVSGVFMMCTALYILRFNHLPQWLKSARPVVLICLLLSFVLYATKIASL